MVHRKIISEEEEEAPQEQISFNGHISLMTDPAKKELGDNDIVSVKLEAAECGCAVSGGALSLCRGRFCSRTYV